jgi:peptidoglycan hydrolase-like protein with peptidoglycan-binding domain
MLATAQITGSKEAMAEAITGAAGPDALPAPRAANRAAPLATVASVDEDGVGAMKVAELKARLKSLGFTASGTKPELQARLRGLAESDAKATLRVHGASPQPPTTDRLAAAGDSDTVKMSGGLHAECREDFRLASAQITGRKAAMAEATTGAAGPDALPAPRAANRGSPLATVASVDEDGVDAMKVTELKH